MWRRASSRLLALRSVPRPSRFVNSSKSPVIPRSAANIVSRHYSGNVFKKDEDVMRIATGHEREELKGRHILDINFPEGPVGAKASGPFLQHRMRFSSSVPSDPDTHDDFKPKNKLDNSEITLKDIVKQDIKDNRVMIYMKGDPEQPRCGFSSLAVRVLSEYRVPIHSRNILEDPELKNAVKDFSTWPTFPQIFINGEFIGGSDIILNMHQNGELKEKLKVTSSE